MSDDPLPVRRRRKEARPAEIVEAARATFIERGFEAAKVEEIARLAGVSKGTVYLYYPTKEALFEAVMRSNVLSVFEAAAAMLKADDDASAAAQLTFILQTFYREMIGTDRRKLMHLMIAEGPRFPPLLEFYHREVVSRGMEIIRTLLERGARRGEFALHGLDRHPKIIIGPAVLAAIYANLFGAMEPDELDDYCRTHTAAVLRMLGVAG